MNKPDIKDIKSKIEKKVDPQHQGFFHTRTFHILLCVGIVLIILILYNCVIRTDKVAVTPEQEELNQQHESMYLDTFDVVGDYLFPPLKTSKEEQTTEAEKTDKQQDKSEAKVSKPTDSEEDIIESADISSDPTPAPPPPPAAPAPTVETIEQ